MNRPSSELLFQIASLDHVGDLVQEFLHFITVTTRASPAPAGLIPLTLNEIRHLYNALMLTPATGSVGSKPG